MRGMPKRVCSAWLWRLSTISAHCVAVPPTPLGPPPPPLNTEPMKKVVTSFIELPDIVNAFFSTWVICPSFSGRVIFETQSLGEMHPEASGAESDVLPALAVEAGTIDCTISRIITQGRTIEAKSLVRRLRRDFSKTCW